MRTARPHRSAGMGSRHPMKIHCSAPRTCLMLVGEAYAPRRLGLRGAKLLSCRCTTPAQSLAVVRGSHTVPGWRSDSSAPLWALRVGESGTRRRFGSTVACFDIGGRRRCAQPPIGRWPGPMADEPVGPRPVALSDLRPPQKACPTPSGPRSASATVRSRLRSPGTGARQARSTAISVERLTNPYSCSGAVGRLGEPPGFSDLGAVAPVSRSAITSPDIRP